MDCVSQTMEQMAGSVVGFDFSLPLSLFFFWYITAIATGIFTCLDCMDLGTSHIIHVQVLKAEF